MTQVVYRETGELKIEVLLCLYERVVPVTSRAQ